MSLIEEALRRVQEGPKNAPATAPPAKAPPTPDAPAHSWPITPASSPPTPKLGAQPRPIARLVLVGVLVGIVAWWLRDALTHRQAPYGRSMPAHRPSQASTAQPRPAPSRPSVAPFSNHPTPAAAAEGMVLSGVVVGVGAPYAVIDGRIVGIGEQVGEATVREITERAVTLRRADGSETVLSVGR